MKLKPNKEIRNYLTYDPESGDFTWLVPLPNGVQAGDKAGTLNANGYWYVTFKGRRYIAHRLAWWFVHNHWPDKQLDHIDECKVNNAIINLRECEQYQNQHNRSLQKNNSTGIKNVSKLGDKFKICMNYNGKQVVQVVVDNLELAELVAIEARDKYHKEFARHE